jgi:hypothetical protein
MCAPTWERKLTDVIGEGSEVMEKATIICFSEIFNYATEKFGIQWNPCNDIFFDNAFEYKRCEKFYYSEWHCRVSFWEDEKAKRKANSFTKEEVLEMSEADQAQVITAAFLEDNNCANDNVRIDSQ